MSVKMRIALPLLLFCACSDAGDESADSLSEDGAGELTANRADGTPKRDLNDYEGRWGASAADCDRGNRYMTEYLEIDEDGFVYRGNDAELLELRPGDAGHADATFIDADGMRVKLRFECDSLVRWPDDPQKRTIYMRCG